jgi:PAB1-binding protein PBP1
MAREIERDNTYTDNRHMQEERGLEYENCNEEMLFSGVERNEKKTRKGKKGKEEEVTLENFRSKKSKPVEPVVEEKRTNFEDEAIIELGAQRSVVSKAVRKVSGVESTYTN